MLFAVRFARFFGGMGHRLAAARQSPAAGPNDFDRVAALRAHVNLLRFGGHPMSPEKGGGIRGMWKVVSELATDHFLLIT
jgi:hypothetical protein